MGALGSACYNSAPRHHGACSPPRGTGGGEWPERVPQWPPDSLREWGGSQAWLERRQCPDASWTGAHRHPLAFCLLLGKEGVTGLAQALGVAGRCGLQD